MARHTAVYKKLEDRTSQNVARSLLRTYNGAIAVDWQAMVSEIVRDFSCQLPTAAKMLREACNDGTLYKLVFSEGRLHQVLHAGEVVYTFEDAPVFQDGGPYRGGLKPGDRFLLHSQRTQASMGVAYPAVFDEWAKPHLEAVAAEKAQEKAEADAKKAAVLANHPELALLVEFGEIWKAHTDALAKPTLPPVEARLFELRHGHAAFTLELRGKRADAAALELLEVLHKHFALPDDNGGE